MFQCQKFLRRNRFRSRDLRGLCHHGDKFRGRDCCVSCSRLSLDIFGRSISFHLVLRRGSRRLVFCRRACRWSARKIHDNCGRRSCGCSSIVECQNMKLQTSRVSESFKNEETVHTPLFHFSRFPVYLSQIDIFAHVKYLTCVTIVMIARLRSYR